MFGDRAEVIAPVQRDELEGSYKADEERVLQLLDRRPCSVEDIANGLGIHRNDAIKYITMLLSKGDICERRTRNGVFYIETRR